MLPKGINNSQLLDRRTDVYIAVIQSASKYSIEKKEVPAIADSIWDALVKPLMDSTEQHGFSPVSSKK